MTVILLAIGAIALVCFVMRSALVSYRTRELDKNYSIEVSADRDTVVGIVTDAAAGVTWQVEATEDGLYTRHRKNKNVIHIVVVAHPRVPNCCTVIVRTRYRYSDHSFLLRMPAAYADTRRRRDRILRTVNKALPVYRHSGLAQPL